MRCQARERRLRRRGDPTPTARHRGLRIPVRNVSPYVIARRPDVRLFASVGALFFVGG